MFENLQDKLDSAFKTLKGQGKITEINVAATIKEIRRALVDADVNYKIAKEFTDKVKEEAMGQNVLTAVSPSQLMVKIVNDELINLMGGSVSEINLKGNPTIILIAGLQGSGKTTFTHKLAHFLKTKKGKNPLMVACDIYRPAAIDQLIVLGKAIDIPVYSEIENKNAVQIAKNALETNSISFDSISAALGFWPCGWWVASSVTSLKSVNGYPSEFIETKEFSYVL